MTAEQFVQSLGADREYQRQSAEREAALAAKRARWRAAEAPLVAELGEVGIEVESVWDLVNTSEPYPAALPILLRALERGEYPDRVSEGAARALAVRPAGHYWDRLVALFRSASGPDTREGLAVALAGSASSATVDALIELVLDARGGPNRVHFVKPLAKLGGPRGRAVLSGLRQDPVIGREIRATLGSTHG